ncbi:MAG TPA: hypothetical protein VFG64_10285 [Dongiaceae bacterium]|nr:hypothetical protein [Dongiaceae bacterium]
MKTLQAMIDTAFGTPEAKRVPQLPSEAFLERERAMAERSDKIEGLRLTRLANGNQTASPPSVLFEVVRHRGHWRTLHLKRHSVPFSDQGAAIAAAKALARNRRGLGRAVEVVLVRTDGQRVSQPIDDE